MYECFTLFTCLQKGRSNNVHPRLTLYHFSHLQAAEGDVRSPGQGVHQKIENWAVLFTKKSIKQKIPRLKTNFRKIFITLQAMVPITTSDYQWIMDMPRGRGARAEELPGSLSRFSHVP